MLTLFIHLTKPSLRCCKENTNLALSWTSQNLKSAPYISQYKYPYIYIYLPILLSLYVFNLFLKVSFYHWFWLIWLWCISVKFFLIFLCLRSLSFLHLCVYNFGPLYFQISFGIPIRDSNCTCIRLLHIILQLNDGLLICFYYSFFSNLFWIIYFYVSKFTNLFFNINLPLILYVRFPSQTLQFL